MAKRKRCPHCRSLDTMPIEYGYPSPEMVASHGRGEIELGGCCISGWEPDMRCRTCGEAFRSAGKKTLKP